MTVHAMFTQMKTRFLILCFLFLSTLSVHAEEKVYLYVLHAQAGEVKTEKPNAPGELVMTQIDESVAFFSYRQDLNATLIPIKDFINFWKSGSSFFTVPPTALIIAYSPKGDFFSRSMGRLSRPRYNVLEKKLTFEVLWFDAKLRNAQLKEISLLIESKVLLNEA
jgi:hypothetical protein